MNYYHILGVSEEATEQEIKDAYRNMINAFHPDHYRGPNKDFALLKTKELVEAYDVLKDPVKRRKYDLSIKKDTFYDRERNDFRKEDSSNADENNTSPHRDDEAVNNDSRKEKSTAEENKQNSQQSELPVKKGSFFKILIAFCILFVAGTCILGVLSNASPYSGTYEYYKMEVRDAEDNLVDTQDAYSSDVIFNIILKNDGTAVSVMQEDYAEGTWKVDRTDGEYTMINLYFTGDNSAAAISYLALFNDNNSALYGFENEGLNYLFYLERK